MPPPATWYSDDLGDRDPLIAMRETCQQISVITSRWSTEFERVYAPGKWTGRQILGHLAQTEIALGYRVRMALAAPDYVAQNFDQDVWMERERTIGGTEARDALVALNHMNRMLFESLSPADRAVRLTHPDIGPLTVDWIIHQMAGHQLHHLRQLERIV